MGLIIEPEGRYRSCLLILDSQIVEFYIYPLAFATFNELVGQLDSVKNDLILIFTFMMKSNLIVLLLAVSVFGYSQCPPSTSTTVLSGNNVAARINHDGTFWNDQLTATAGYEVPVSTGKNTIYSGALWIGAVDTAGAVRVAAQQFGAASGQDYWAGPIDETTGLAYDCVNFDRFYNITESEVMDFLQFGTVSAGIENWPGRGNPLLSYLPDQDLAPFIDANNDGIYNPYDGDYPAMKGRQASWWVINDVGNTHSVTGGDPVGMEIQIMAYSYSTFDALNNQSFYELKMINKSLSDRNDFYFGVWVDPDLGNYQDDYIGCDSASRTMFVYNSDSFDENSAGSIGYGGSLPVQGITFPDVPLLNGALAFPARGFKGYTGGPAPSTPADFYNEMAFAANFVDPIGGVSSNYQFHDNPSVAGGWSECGTVAPPGDRRMMMSFGPGDLSPMDEVTACFGAIYHNTGNNQNCDGVTGLLNLISDLGSFCTHPTVSAGELEESTITIFPNPATEAFELTGVSSGTVSVYNQLGQLVISQENYAGESISVEDLRPGSYAVHFTSRSKTIAFKLMVSSK